MFRGGFSFAYLASRLPFAKEKKFDSARLGTRPTYCTRLRIRENFSRNKVPAKYKTYPGCYVYTTRDSAVDVYYNIRDEYIQSHAVMVASYPGLPRLLSLFIKPGEAWVRGYSNGACLRNSLNVIQKSNNCHCHVHVARQV